MHSHWNRNGGERVIPIFIEGGTPTPSPSRHSIGHSGHDEKQRNEKPERKVVPNQVNHKIEGSKSHPDFRSFELDEMDAIAEALKQKRARDTPTRDDHPRF